ncbi:MAG: DUF262 domain-containing protein [Chryseobacterium sp.]|nr:DUF262 domain-containing protein [Chryseobacterium sp.]
MENRVYYGQYSLKHWIDLILKKNIKLPDYQRYFVWNETKVKTLIETFKKKQFVPPITIGLFKNGGADENLILDGQQRLTSILLAYLGLYPDPATFKSTVERLANDNDDDNEDQEEILDNILSWDFKKLTEKGKNKDDFLKQTFLGFSYLVPQTDNQDQQQRYYSSVFRNINIQGEMLLPQESRASLYFLKNNLEKFFDPDFSKQIVLKNFSSESKVDFVRFLAMLSQYAKDGNSNRIARGYKPKMEKYYEEYIYSVVENNDSPLFKRFSTIFPGDDYAPRFEKLASEIDLLHIPKQFNSIIEMDVFLFGLIYVVVFENKSLDESKIENLYNLLNAKITEFKGDYNHRKSPSALKHLKARIDASIGIYKRFKK